jgi:hypothetical protein
MPKKMAAWLALLLIIGCGGVTVSQVTDATYTDGVRYWDSQPYVTSAGTIIWLPDPTRGYVVKPKWSLVSATTLNVSVINGWQLSTVGATQTPQVLPAIQEIAKTVAGKLMVGKQGEAPPPIELYPLWWDDSARAWRVGR